MKKLYHFLLLICITTSSYAQHHFILGVGKSRNNIKTDELNSFTSTFNDYHKGNGFVPLNNFKATMEPLNFSGGYRYMKDNGFSLGMIYMYSKKTQQNQTTLMSKTGYEFNYKGYSNDFIFELGYSIGGIITINALGSLGISNNHMQIWKVYANGDKSLGAENDLPGHYKAVTTHADLGGSIGLKLWKFYFPLRVTYGMPVFSKGELGMTDFDRTHRYRNNEMPKDYKQWATNAMDYDPDNFISGDQFTGIRIHLGVEFMIPLGGK